VRVADIKTTGAWGTIDHVANSTDRPFFMSVMLRGGRGRGRVAWCASAEEADAAARAWITKNGLN
jgi:hypothetical protein